MLVVSNWYCTPPTSIPQPAAPPLLARSTHGRDVATVGFGDYSFAHHSAAMEIYAIVLILVGVTLVSTAFALFTNILSAADRASLVAGGCRHGGAVM